MLIKSAVASMTQIYVMQTMTMGKQYSMGFHSSACFWEETLTAVLSYEFFKDFCEWTALEGRYGVSLQRKGQVCILSIRKYWVSLSSVFLSCNTTNCMCRHHLDFFKLFCEYRDLVKAQENEIEILTSATLESNNIICFWPICFLCLQLLGNFGWLVNL